MASTNPVFSSAEGFTTPRYGNTAYAPGPNYQDPYAGQSGSQNYGGYSASQVSYPGSQDPAGFIPGYAPGVANQQGVMTLEDVITKSAITLGLLIITAAISMVAFTSILSSGVGFFPVILGCVVAAALVFVVSSQKIVKPALVLAYSVVEGILIGWISAAFEMLFPGIVITAVLGTFVAAIVTLAAYRSGIVRVTARFKKIVTIGTMAVFFAMLLNLLLMFILPQFALYRVGSGMGLIGLAVTLICIGLAVANLVMDFDVIENGIRNQLPAQESWRAALGLTVTLVWLYTEILRFLSYFRD